LGLLQDHPNIFPQPPLFAISRCSLKNDLTQKGVFSESFFRLIPGTDQYTAPESHHPRREPPSEGGEVFLLRPFPPMSRADGRTLASPLPFFRSSLPSEVTVIRKIPAFFLPFLRCPSGRVEQRVFYLAPLREEGSRGKVNLRWSPSSFARSFFLQVFFPGPDLESASLRRAFSSHASFQGKGIPEGRTVRRRTPLLYTRRFHNCDNFTAC